jgi:hypothetical protein
MTEDDRTGPTWDQFRVKHNWGTGKENSNRHESKKARKKRLKGMSQNSKKKKKKKTQRQRELQQFSLDGENITLNDAEEFADKMRDKPANTVRLALQNEQLIPANARHYKSRQLINHISQAQLDVLLMNEVGLNWRALSAENQWIERITGKLQGSKAVFAHNTTELNTTDEIQYGGVGIVATQEIANRIISTGRDPKRLGRWTWIRIQGKEGHTTRIATAYRPWESPGASTVFHQQARGLSKTGDHRNPIDALTQDLADAINEWKEAGDHIIIGMDANEDVRTGDINALFEGLGLREAILDKHKDKSPPATQNRNTKRQPIDGIWVSACISISAGGYLAFGDACPSDHRMLWIEIQYSIAFGQKSPEIAKITPKRLKTSDPRLVKKYNLRVKKAMRDNGFRKRYELLKKQTEFEAWNEEIMIEQYDQLDSDDREIRDTIERGIRKLTMGGIPWSPKLQPFRDAIELWKMIRRKRKGMKISVKRIRRFMIKTQIRDALTNDLEQVEIRLTQACKAYKKATKSAGVWRNDFLESLAEAKAEKKGTDTAKELKSLLQIEKQRRQARSIKRMRGKLGTGQVTKVYQTDEDGTRIVCETQVTMVKAFHKENDSRFSQTGSTPPMKTPLVEDLGYLAETEMAEQVLEGTYEPAPDVDQYAKELLHELRRPECVRKQSPTNITATVDEHVLGWKRTKEKSAESSGPSMAEVKAASQDSILAEIDTFMRNLPYTKGFAPRSWKLITDVEILKKAGVYDVEKMRTIQLMHAVFNMNNKKLGRDMMRSAESNNILAREQFGSRKHHQSIIAALNKRLTMDLLRQRRQAGALCSNDAKSCYDRIVHNVASLAIRRTGMPAEPVRSMFSTLQQAAHRVTTAYGISEQTYGTNLAEPYQGVGQGNGAGPAIWAVISTVVISMMSTAGHGFHIISAITATLVTMVCYAFVDDTDVVQSACNVIQPGEEVVPQMQSSVDRWEGGLRATGGALVPAKSHWYLIDFKWTGKLWKYRSIEEMPGELSILDTTGQRVTLNRHEPKVATETLGVWQAMDGNNKEQIAQLKKKTEDFAECMRTGYLSRNDAWYAINTTIMKTLEYPMTATTIGEKEWEEIMVPLLDTGLPRSGMSSKFPRDVLFGPTTVQGFGVMHPWYHQQLLHLIAFLEHTEQQTMTGQLLSAGVEQLRLELGTSGYITDNKYSTMKDLVTETWVTDLWKFTDRFKIRIHDEIDQLRLQRTNDRFLMNEFITAGYHGKMLKELNECRMLLHALTLSDIVTADGREISMNAWNGRKDEKDGKLHEWPRTQRGLPEEHWKQWRRVLDNSFLSNRDARGLKEVLLDWHDGTPRNWKWYFCSAEDRLYAKEGLLWRVYCRHRSRTSPRQGRSTYVKTEQLLREPPDGLRIASVMKQGQFIIYQCSGALMNITSDTAQNPVIESFEEGRLLRPPLDQWAIQEITVTDDGKAMAQAIRNGTAIAVSDGSYKTGRGTAAFILETSANFTKKGRIVGVNSIPGEKEDQSSYRSEIGGVSGIVETAGIICVRHAITSGAVEVGLDGDQAMKNIFGTWPLNPKQADYDLLKDLRKKIKDSPITWTGRWVEGHQDDQTQLDDLDRWGQLNVECDGLAKAYWNECMNNDSWLPNKGFADEGWSVWIEGKKLTKLDKQALYDYCFSKRTKAYWSKKHNLTTELITNINWDACQQALHKLPFGKRRWLLKHATGFCGVGKMEQRRGNQDHAECPSCGQFEDAIHVARCKGTGTDVVFELAVQKLEITMGEKFTAPDIAAIIGKRIRQWRKHSNEQTIDQETPIPRYYKTDEFGTKDAVKEQDRIGWYNLLLGRMSKKWMDAQQKYLESIGKRTTGRRWAIAIISKLWDIAWDMWQHRNHIKHNTLHPRKQQEMDIIGQRVTVLYEQGSEDLLARDRSLFLKSLTTLLKGNGNEQEQWITSVILAQQRAEAAKADRNASMTTERKLMETWLGILHAIPEAEEEDE